VQFKSRTEKIIEYREKRLQALLSQELSLFIAKVNLKAGEIKLYSVGAALQHPNIIDASGIVVYLDPASALALLGISAPSGLLGYAWRRRKRV